MLNNGLGFSDEFELEACRYSEKSSSKLKQQYREWTSTMKKEGSAFFKSVKEKVRWKPDQTRCVLNVCPVPGESRYEICRKDGALLIVFPVLSLRWLVRPLGQGRWQGCEECLQGTEVEAEGHPGAAAAAERSREPRRQAEVGP